jgi:hypothetical protein
VEEKLNNKQKFWLSFTAIFMIGIFINSLVIGLAWVNSPTIWSTYHNFDLKSDEYSASMLESISDITKNSKDVNYGEKINCIMKALYWDYETQKYIEDTEFRFSQNCYAVESLKVQGSR